MRTTWGIFALLAAGTIAPAGARAQDSNDVQRHSAALVLDHTFNAPVGEPVRVFLAKGVTYRAELEGESIQLALKPLLSSVQPPLIEPILGGESAAGESLYSITPRADALYVFTTSGTPTGDLANPVRLRVRVAPGSKPPKS
ncbi:MAG TPA: hypothetical protein VGL65_05045 [Gemmatimonadales bacterium]|jgi:hypothetical protein